MIKSQCQLHFINNILYLKYITYNCITAFQKDKTEPVFLMMAVNFTPFCSAIISEETFIMLRNCENIFCNNPVNV